MGRPFWSTAIEVVIPGMGELAEDTRRRYVTSIRAFQRKVAAFAAEDEAFETLAGLSASSWEALDRARMRGVTVPQLHSLAQLAPADRRATLRECRLRISEGVFEVLGDLPRPAWFALRRISDYFIDEELINALDRLRAAERKELRIAAQKLGTAPPVGDLTKLSKADWARFSRSWGGSGADWNHMRRAVSAVLSDLFKTTHHQFRVSLMERIPLMEEVERIVDLPQELFWRIVSKLPPEANDFPVLLVLTGARIGEYERMTRAHLKPRAHVVDMPGTKTNVSLRNVTSCPRCGHTLMRQFPRPVSTTGFGVSGRRHRPSSASST